MAYKHQTNSYRNRAGRRYVCWEDTPNKAAAQASVKALKDSGKSAFYESGDGGAYYRVFVEAAS